MRVVRSVRSFVAAAAVAVFVSAAAPAAAQTRTASGADAVQPVPLSLRHLSLEPVAELAPAQPLFPAHAAAIPERPGALLPLYGSMIALQGLDIHSTRSALGSGGGREANPVMRPLVRNSAAFVATKAAATTGVIWASEKMWKKNGKAAVIFAGLVNVAMAAVVANNYRVSR